jgi:aminomethyltransferase
MTLKRTPLYEDHLKLKGRMVPFAGYEMPVQYSGVIAEHEAVRKAVGLFDVSHMGEFWVTGAGAKAWLNRMTTNDMDKLFDGRCQYNLLCYENGTVVDDIIVSQVSADAFLIVVNASNADKDFAWLQKHKPADVELQNIGDEFSLVAVQGPNSPELMKRVFNRDFSALKYYHFEILPEAGAAPLAGTFVSRTGYTGEDGFEVLVPNSKAVKLWNDLLAKGTDLGVLPTGLGARDTLRLEAAYSLYGHEISDAITGLEAGLGWVIKPDKGEFIGREALAREKAEGSKRKLVGFEMTESAIARDGAEAYDGSGAKIGRVTSGTHSPTLKKAIGLALIDAPSAVVGNKFELDIRGKRKKAVVVEKPFYKKK